MSEVLWMTLSSPVAVIPPCALTVLGGLSVRTSIAVPALASSIVLASLN